MRPSSHLLVPALTILNWSVGAAYASANSLPLARSASILQHDSEKRQFFTADYGTSSSSAPKHLYQESHAESTDPSTDSASVSKDPPSAERHRRRITLLNLPILNGIASRTPHLDSGLHDAERHPSLGRAMDDSIIRARSILRQIAPVGAEVRAVTTQEGTRDSPVELHRQPAKDEDEGGAKRMSTRFARDPFFLEPANRRFARELIKRRLLSAVLNPLHSEALPPRSEPQSDVPEDATPKAAGVIADGRPSIGFKERMTMRRWIMRDVDAEGFGDAQR